MKGEDKWIYNKNYQINQKISGLMVVSPLLVGLLISLICLVLRLFNRQTVIFLMVVSVVSFISTMAVSFTIGKEFEENRNPIKVKITDSSLYFMSASGKTKEIKIEDIEVINLRKTLFDGAFVSIIERVDKDKVRYHHIYLSRELGEEIIRRHSKYVDYNFKKKS